MLIILFWATFSLLFVIFMIVSDCEMVRLDEQWMEEYKKWKEK
jgi:hypothetical protein